MPQVIIPREYSKKRTLIAIPRRKYEEFVAYKRSTEEAIAAIKEAEADMAAGRFVSAASLEEALQ